jgi:hypothetical protein
VGDRSRVTTFVVSIILWLRLDSKLNFLSFKSLTRFKVVGDTRWSMFCILCKHFLLLLKVCNTVCYLSVISSSRLREQPEFWGFK